MTPKSGVQASPWRLERVLLTETSVIVHSCNVGEIKVCRRCSDRQRVTFHERRALKRRKVLFFFQAEDGIRDVAVTGVQTCALPISPFKVTQYGLFHHDIA